MEIAGILRPIPQAFSRPLKASHRSRYLALADVLVARREGKREKAPESARRPQSEFLRILSVMSRRRSEVNQRAWQYP
jgi:hypothetical protein